ncbi:MAG: O-antigen/teichoic acid export membrane protein [Flavobacteriaceae bacterium]|jgi:O-antigen/teichoic acid export membrane protein|uniref:lipopolysaccharide biosynthesis protein n=1 Tax=Candidatus Marifrigoribacter sp. Uisw_064 TaxID=3230970 RepID=UPI003AD90999
MSKKLYKSFGYKGLQIIVLILYSLLLIPILLNYWDLEVYGAWIALYAFFNLIQVIELGHSVYIGNEFNRIVHTQKEKAKVLLGSAIRANILVGVLQLSIVFILFKLGLLRYLLDKNIDDREIAIVISILLLYRMCIGSFRGIIVKTLNPFGLIYKAFQFSLVEKILEFFILVVAAFSGISLIKLAILWFSAKFVYSFVILIKLKYLQPEFFPWWKYGSFKFGFNNFKKSLPFAASNFLDRLSNDGIVLVVSAIVGTSFLPLFSATRTLVNFGLKISDFFLSPMVPEMINYYSMNKKEKILDILRSFWFVSGAILITGFAISLFFIEDLFHIWTNQKLQFNLGLYSALVIIFLVQNFGKSLVVFYTSINKTYVVLITSILRMSLFFIIAFSLKQYQLDGVLISLLISELIVVTFWLPFNAFKFFTFSFYKKIYFFLYLISLLPLGIILYLNYLGKPLWLLICLFVPIVFLIYFQYKLISENTRRTISEKLKKLAIFVSN